MNARAYLRASTSEQDASRAREPHVRTASESGPNKVTLVMDTWEGGGFGPDLEGNLKSVWETLTRTPVDLTWT
jgi:hypothetical protein